MYEKYWELHHKPFANTMNPDFFFFSKEHEEALVRMLFTVSESKGLMLFTGYSGLGKTYISNIFAREMRDKGFRVGMIRNPQLGPVEFLRETLYALGDHFDSNDKVAILHRLWDILREQTESGSESVLIVDEAQLVKDPATFEEIRLLLNLDMDDRFPITVILEGSPALATTVAHNRELQKRVGVSFHMTGLGQNDSKEYIHHRLKVAGATRNLFTDEACEAVYRFSHGVPRDVNNICDMSLLLASGAQEMEVSAGTVKEAVGELRGADLPEVNTEEISLNL